MHDISSHGWCRPLVILPFGNVSFGGARNKYDGATSLCWIILCILIHDTTSSLLGIAYNLISVFPTSFHLSRSELPSEICLPAYYAVHIIDLPSHIDHLNHPSCMSPTETKGSCLESIIASQEIGGYRVTPPGMKGGK